MELYPFVNAENMISRNSGGEQGLYFLFNTTTNRGFAVDGLAALFCKELNGKKKLKDIINDFEQVYELESGKFEKEIATLMKDLQENGLLILREDSLND